MFFLKVATFFLVALAVSAEKKIELQDIEEDNLRSELRTEQEKDHDKSDVSQNSGPGTAPAFNSLDFMKTGLLRLFENPQTHSLPQQQRYVHQYAVTEQPERLAPAANKAQFEPQAPQHAMVGYLSNMPMQIYLVPQYYEQSQQSNPPQAEFPRPGLAGTANNYVQVPSYVPPTGKSFEQHYAPPQAVTYVYQTQPTPPPQPTVAPVVAYQVPVYQYNPRVVVPSNSPKPYYANPEYTDTNSVDEISEQEQKQYSTQTEIPYFPTVPEFPRHYNSRAPIREQYNRHGVPDLPRPNPLLFNAPPAHLAHIPRALPFHRPLSKPVYKEGDLVSSSFTPRPHGLHGPPFTRRPMSLLDSYVPSTVQVEYLKRGLAKDPSSLYEALASGRLPHSIPRHYERGFLPNQMYPTAAGGAMYGHYKRNPKIEKFPHK